MEKINQWALKNQGKILFLTAVFFLLKFFSGLPYINLVLNLQGIVVVLSVLIIVVFNLSRKLFFLLALFCLFLSLPLLLMGDQRAAERFGDVTYWFLILGFVGEWWQNRFL